MTNYLTAAQENELLETALIEGEFILASGVRARQKFEFDNIATNPYLLDLAATALVRCIDDHYHSYDAIVSVAYGATDMGDMVAANLGVPHIQTAYRKRGGEKRFRVRNVTEATTSAIIVDDVFTHGTNSTKVINVLSKSNIETQGVAVVLNRSGIYEPILDGVPVHYLMQKELN